MGCSSSRDVPPPSQPNYISPPAIEPVQVVEIPTLNSQEEITTQSDFSIADPSSSGDDLNDSVFEMSPQLSQDSADVDISIDDEKQIKILTEKKRVGHSYDGTRPKIIAKLSLDSVQADDQSNTSRKSRRLSAAEIKFRERIEREKIEKEERDKEKKQAKMKRVQEETVSKFGAFNFAVPGNDVMSNVTSAMLGTGVLANVHQTTTSTVSMIGSAVTGVQSFTMDGAEAVGGYVGFMADMVTGVVPGTNDNKVASMSTTIDSTDHVTHDSNKSSCVLANIVIHDDFVPSGERKGSGSSVSGDEIISTEQSSGHSTLTDKEDSSTPQDSGTASQSQLHQTTSANEKSNISISDSESLGKPVSEVNLAVSSNQTPPPPRVPSVVFDMDDDDIDGDNDKQHSAHEQSNAPDIPALPGASAVPSATHSSSSDPVEAVVLPPPPAEGGRHTTVPQKAADPENMRKVSSDDMSDDGLEEWTL